MRAHDDRTLQALIHRSLEPLIVESHCDAAGWGRPWRAFGSADWEEIERTFGKGVHCATLETGANRELALLYGLEIIPQVLVFLGGQVVARFTGHVRVANVIAIVREELRRAKAREDAIRELDVVLAAGERHSQVRPVLQHLPRQSPGFAHAG